MTNSGLGSAIRLATTADRDAVWPLVVDFATSFGPNRHAFDASLTRLIDASDALVLVAQQVEDGVGILGYLLAFVHDTLFASAPVAWVEEVMVDPLARCTGIGRGLMSAAEDWARVRGAAYIGLATRRAAPFYSALGYEDSAIMFRRLLT